MSDIVIERTFDAPPDLIWQLWTQPEHLKNWYGPQGFNIRVARMDVHVGGKRLICMQMPKPDGTTMNIWTTGEFTELVPHQRLAYTDSPSDENGNIVLLDGDEDPLITIVTVVLEDLGGRTKMVTTHTGLPSGESGARQGWEQAIAKMDGYITTIQQNPA